MTGLSSPIDLRHIPGLFVLGVCLLLAPSVVVSQQTEPVGSRASQDVQIVVGFDGSCPHDPTGVKQEGPRQFRIFPSWRPSPGIDEEAVGRSTRLGFKVVNTDEAAQTVDLWIDWQNKHTDGLLGLDPAVRERFVRLMPDQLEFGKQWSIRDPKPLSAEVPEKELLRNYCERNFGAVAVTFEFPWFGRTTDDMRNTGRKALWALLRAIDPPPTDLR